MADRQPTRETMDKLAELAGGAALLYAGDGTPIARAGVYPADREPSLEELRSLLGEDDIRAVAGDGVITVILRLGAGILVLDNRRQVENHLQFRRIIEESLPYIAQVAGGDAVLFDERGIRVRAAHPDGSPNPGALGVLTHLCRQVMSELRPSVGPSVMTPGATAVRIPLTPEYGLAFNNQHASKQRQRLLDNVSHYRYARYHIEDIVGQSPAIAKARNLARDAARSQSTVLITGETGTGKELFAQAIHNLGSRAAQPFVAINCGAIPAELVESILFGYAEGAFTGARKAGQVGAFEQANGGTLFLDEISEMPYHLQVKLLRALQEREVTRLGDNKALAVDVRVVASTNKSLLDLIRDGKFRPDLYFRLNVIEILIPPLRDRMEDVLALTDHFMKKYSAMMGKRVQEITPAAMRALCSYDWPGNIRELQNSLEYAFNIIGAGCRSIAPEHLPPAVTAGGDSDAALSPYDEHMRRAEREIVHRALELCGYNKAEAARRLGVNRTTLWRIIARHGLDKHD
ncbi:sigma-54 interaction domain-containing protein [Anaeroselena agilis]|uniref:Sigma 54-interacting transcriptional regulator n=1 Tax=Anaeroselena agilis TaxID=3063788 RepID=A0ABU3NY59_9FIRM|nr:sigma 54-interacting transcriptional regulator [Selenomonadales bacterium 4137-cl]